jgi:hypothetical protein
MPWIASLASVPAGREQHRSDGDSEVSRSSRASRATHRHRTTGMVKARVKGRCRGDVEHKRSISPMPTVGKFLDVLTTDGSMGARCVPTTPVQPRIDSFAGIPVSRTRPTSSARQKPMAPPGDDADRTRVSHTRTPASSQQNTAYPRSFPLFRRLENRRASSYR